MWHVLYGIANKRIFLYFSIEREGKTKQQPYSSHKLTKVDNNLVLSHVHPKFELKIYKLSLLEKQKTNKTNNEMHINLE